MTDQEKMREEFETWWENNSQLRDPHYQSLCAWQTCAAQSAETIARLEKELQSIDDDQENAYRDGWMDGVAQSAETIARLEKELQSIKNFDTAHRSYKIAAWQAEYAAQKLAASQADNVKLREALETIAELLPKDAQCQCAECTSGRAALAALAHPLDTSALDAYVASKMAAWHPIETAPKDGTVIDLLIDGERITDCYWGVPNHSCGEAGRYCDSDWHNLSDYWVCSIFNEQLGEGATHWMPRPPSPDKQGE